MRPKNTSPMLISLVLLVGLASVAQASMPSEARPQKPPITVGMSAALSGPASELGQQMRIGLTAAFEECNRAGGIQNRRINLIALDDGYEPPRAAANVRKLIHEHDVLALLGNVGTPTAVMTIPIINESGTVLFGAFTGAGILRKSPPDRYVINYRASYAAETAAMVDALINHAGLSVDEIAFFTQRDAYGDAGFLSGIKALKQHGLVNEQTVPHGRYERNTTVVENGLADIVGSKVRPRAVIMVGAYKPCAEFIKLARRVGFDAIFLNVSFVGSRPLSRSLGAAGEEVIITQVVPHYRSEIPLIGEYEVSLKAVDSSQERNFVSLEGYIVGRIFVKALKQLEVPITRESVLTALEDLEQFDIGLDIPLELSRDEHQASHQVWPTVIRGGLVVPFEWSEWSSEAGK